MEALIKQNLEQSHQYALGGVLAFLASLILAAFGVPIVALAPV